LTQICTKSFVGWGFAPDPTEGAYSAFPDPKAVFRWPLLTERRGAGFLRSGKVTESQEILRELRKVRENREGQGKVREF